MGRWEADRNSEISRTRGRWHTVQTEDFCVSLEQDARAVLGELREQKYDPWGRHARRMAAGIERAGVAGLLEDVSETATAQLAATKVATAEARASAEQVTRGIAALAAVNATGFANICSALAVQTTHLEDIASLLANPLSTAAQERYRRGLHALNHGWNDDAATEFSAAVESDPFAATAHFGLALALGRLADHSEALARFRAALKYCGVDPSLQPLSAQAALLAAQAADTLGDHDEAVRVLHEGIVKVPECAELHLALASRTGDEDALRTSLSIAPDLAILAVSKNLDSARDVAEDVATSPSGPIQQMRRAAEIFHEIGGRDMSPIPEDVPEAMTYHHRWAIGEHLRATGLAAEVRAERNRCRQLLTAREQQPATPAPPPPKVGAASESLIFAAIAVTAFIFFASLFWSGLQSFIHGTPGGSDDAMWTLIKLVGGAFCGVWSGIFTIVALTGVAKDVRENDSKREALARHKADERAVAEEIVALREDLGRLDRKAHRAGAMESAIHNSIPNRVIPMESAR